MRGARELFHEYILELHGRIERMLYRADKIASDILVGHDGAMHVIAGEYHEDNIACYLIVVLGETGDVSRL